MKDSAFSDGVRAAFDGLLRRGALHFVSSRHDEESFGNAEVVLAGGSFRVRIVRDRGDVFADVGPSGSSEWWPLERALQAVGIADAPEVGIRPVEESASLLSKHLGAIESGFSPRCRAETLRVLQALDTATNKRIEDGGR